MEDKGIVIAKSESDMMGLLEGRKGVVKTNRIVMM